MGWEWNMYIRVLRLFSGNLNAGRPNSPGIYIQSRYVCMYTILSTAIAFADHHFVTYQGIYVLEVCIFRNPTVMRNIYSYVGLRFGC